MMSMTVESFSTCLVTIFACTWVSVHSNVPPPHFGPVSIALRLFSRMVVAVIVPEVMIYFALDQFMVARKHTKEYALSLTHGFFISIGGFVTRHGHHLRYYPDYDLEVSKVSKCMPMFWAWEVIPKERGRGVGMISGLTAYSVALLFGGIRMESFFSYLNPTTDVEKYNFSITHGFFISMGGFVTRQGHHPIIEPEQFTEEILADIKATKAQDIEDRSKGDAQVFYLALLYQAKAFNFTHNDPTSCDDFTVQWTSGSPPFYLTLVPVFGIPRNFSIPSDSFSDGKGSFSTQLPFPKNVRFVAIMSDSTNYGSGGDTSDLQVGASKGGQCNITSSGVDFPFQLNTALQQCRTLTFSGYDGAKQPVTILGIIPSGDIFVLHPPTGSTSFDWTANVWNGTRVMFLMFDSQGRQGGSSDIRTVSATDNSSCIDASSPSTTASPSETGGSSDSDSGTPVGAIAGSVLGALVNNIKDLGRVQTGIMYAYYLN
ncbi:hypothetical protein D9758_007409 [Tetrapyrgos nigripes]|uniref:Uncharacterized protein n=1 Tax=Tetrapyrgos nigripes TaxID=182062 RepID=A0A8H5LHU9_9AGAR|nr:hypothetical protein D9758_007409 [Tetrapyrgos nigripes]